MDKSNEESLLFSKTNKIIENIKKAYANGDISMSQILDKTELNSDFETMSVAANCFIPQELLDNSTHLEDKLKQEVQLKKQTIPIIHIPGKVFFTKQFESCLTKREQAVCLNALKLTQSGCTASKLTKVQNQDLSLAMELKPKVLEENLKFIEYVKSDWNNKSKRALNLKETIKSYAYTMWQKKLAHVHNYPQFYKVEDIVCFSNDKNESEVSVSYVSNLCEVGVVPKFIKPCLEFKHILKVNTLPSIESFSHHSKLPVSEDPKVAELINTTPINIVISSSGLKQLMDDTNVNSEWTIPVIVKTHPDNTEKTVVYIDKPITKRFPSPIDFNYYCQKLLVKTNFCRYPGISYNTEDFQVPLGDISDFEDEVKTKKKENSLNDRNSINYMKELNEFTKLIRHNKGRDEDMLQILNGKAKILHNASYRIWNMKYANEQNSLLKTKHTTKNIQVLIRCKLDACQQLENGTVQPLIIVPKLEYQLEHGANLPTKKELVDQWTALFFRPFSHLHRLRMQCNTSEIVDVESVSLQKINTEANNIYNYKPHLRLDVLYEIFAKLMELKVGNYVLRYSNDKGPFIEIYTQCDSSISTCDKFDFHKFYSTEICSYTVPKGLAWIPIDTTYILPVHTTFKRMPGMFRPLIPKISKKKGKKQKSKKMKKKLQKTNS